MIRIATINDLNEIMKIKIQAVDLMKKDNNDQWNENYPSRNSFISYINREELYVSIIDNKVVGMIVITTLQDSHYESVNWSISSPFYTLHRLAIKKGFRGKQIASSLLIYAKQMASENNI